MKSLILTAFAFCAFQTAYSATYYIDPAKGDISSDGSSAKPWNTLEAVFAAKKTFAAGDVLHLRTGYHGALVITGANSGPVTIQPDKDAKPTVKSLVFKTASQWVVSGLDICPEHAGAGTFEKRNHVEIQKGCDHITVKDCSIRSALSTDGWTEADWAARMGTAVNSNGSHSTIANNSITYVGFGIMLVNSATNSLVSRNTIKEFMSDGMRALADDCVIEYNTVANCYAVNDNHDDCFQSYSIGPEGKVGTGTVKNVTLRGNTFISQTDPNQPFPSKHLQGIGLFDGMFENWVFENNVISLGASSHGISLYGAINCKVANNTVVINPIGATAKGKPSIMIVEHKANKNPPSPWPVKSSGNLARNNIACGVNVAASIGTADHNLTTKDFSKLFVDYQKFDFSPAPGGPAIGKGDATDAPKIDIRERPRTAPYDIGAYQH